MSNDNIIGYLIFNKESGHYLADMNKRYAFFTEDFISSSTVLVVNKRNAEFLANAISSLGRGKFEAKALKISENPKAEIWMARGSSGVWLDESSDECKDVQDAALLGRSLVTYLKSVKKFSAIDYVPLELEE